MRLSLIALAVLFFAALPTAHASSPIPRVLYALYDEEASTTPRYTMIHRAVEMPLNWLGYHIEYIERDGPFPPWRDDVAGAILWLPSGSYVEPQDAYLDWLEHAIGQRKKLLIMGNPGFNEDLSRDREHFNRVNAVLAYIGMRAQGGWQSQTYGVEIISQNAHMVGFEKPYAGALPPFHHVAALPQTDTHLQVRSRLPSGEHITNDLVTTHRNGGYIAHGYGLFFEEDDEGEFFNQRWYIHPFRFLNAALGSINHPRPDVTTLTGRRIFYSHLDGDGWNNYTEIPKYRNQKVIAAQVLYDEIYTQYPHLPFTVGPIVAELDTACYGRPQSADIARKIFALPNVEPSSHTHSHPLYWEFFGTHEPSVEAHFLDRYPTPPGTRTSIYEAITQLFHRGHFEEAWQDILRRENYGGLTSTMAERLLDDYDRPRSYACQPYDLELEVRGSVEYLQTLAPPHKRVKLYQWSGDTTPYEGALREVREAGLLNINGGDSRFDADYPSYSYVAPIGLKVGNERQIFSSNSNENIYTDLWKSHFFGFLNLKVTVDNTDAQRVNEERPRISPFNVYYHTYSGEKSASLEALKRNLDYASTSLRSHSVIPIFTSHYAQIANGYFSTTIEPLGTRQWRIRNRGALQTIRFDRAEELSIDWSASQGVIGQHHYKKSLYVFLNPSHFTPIIALREPQPLPHTPPAPHPYVIDSRLIIDNVEQIEGGIAIKGRGLGTLPMELYWPYGNMVTFIRNQEGKELKKSEIPVNEDGTLTIVFDSNDLNVHSIVLQEKGSPAHN